MTLSYHIREFLFKSKIPERRHYNVLVIFDTTTNVVTSFRDLIVGDLTHTLTEKASVRVGSSNWAADGEGVLPDQLL
jgi:hypothetical protein